MNDLEDLANRVKSLIIGELHIGSISGTYGLDRPMFPSHVPYYGFDTRVHGCTMSFYFRTDRVDVNIGGAKAVEYRYSDPEFPDNLMEFLREKKDEIRREKQRSRKNS